MKRKRVAVQTCLLCEVGRRYGSLPTTDLLGIRYVRTVLPDTEFPTDIARADLFVRFWLAGAGRTSVAVRVYRLFADGSVRERVAHIPFDVTFHPDEVVREQVFRLVNITIPGEGMYAVRVCVRGKRDGYRPAWKVLGADFFRIER